MAKRKKSYSNKRKVVRKNWTTQLFYWLIVCGMLVMTYLFALVLLTTQNPSEEPVQDTSSEDFIEALAPHAKSIQRRHGILPSIILGQAILESDWGKSELSRKYHNLFGMKAYGDGEKVLLKTKEYTNDKWIEVEAEFKVYENWEASMDDHAALFVNGVSWDSNLYQEVLLADNYQQAATALQKAGYATDPDYSNKIIGVIEGYELQQYD